MKLHYKMVEVIDDDATGKDARELRQSQGKSLRAVADAVGCSVAFLSDLELGQRRWDAERVEKFVAAVNRKGGKK